MNFCRARRWNCSLREICCHPTHRQYDTVNKNYDHALVKYFRSSLLSNACSFACRRFSSSLCTHIFQALHNNRYFRANFARLTSSSFCRNLICQYTRKRRLSYSTAQRYARCFCWYTVCQCASMDVRSIDEGRASNCCARTFVDSQKEGTRMRTETNLSLHHTQVCAAAKRHTLLAASEHS